MERDDSQKKVIAIESEYHLVLAPPGCGKTDLLAERIANALRSGVKQEDMLCLTFTNRAARGMRERIKRTINEDASSIFVGNVHRYCSVFLFENNHVPMNTAILDENDVRDIINDYSHNTVYDIEHYIYQIQNNHPANIILKKDLETDILTTLGIEKNIYIIPIYENIESILNLIKSIGNDNSLLEEADLKEADLEAEEKIRVTQRRNEKITFLNENYNIKYKKDSKLFQFIDNINSAKLYRQYKAEYDALDFDDLLLHTYNILAKPESAHHRYSWIQIDEVQDLNPMQMAIADLLTKKSDETCVVYLGDEQQAIFSFQGASIGNLNQLKKRCGNNLHRLEKNYRSPNYLLQVFNEFATKELGINSDLLPTATNNEQKQENDLVISHCLNDIIDNGNDEVDENGIIKPYKEVANLVNQLLNKEKRHENDQQRVAIIVPTNNIADEFVNYINYPCFKISGQDAFSTPTIQMLFSHLSVIAFETNKMAWAKIFRQLKLTGISTYSESRAFAKEIAGAMMSPVDLLQYDDSTYLQEFYKIYKNEYIIFDTETTGLNVFNDDIIQIAAIKICGGEITDTFTIFLKTDKEIPPYLGNTVNPMVEEYKKPMNKKYERNDGLRLFLQFVGDTPLLAHNAEYDYHILDYNLRRDCGLYNLTELCPCYFDSLKIIRLVEPRLRTYKLKDLLTALNLEGENSHNAEDDIIATKSVVDYCMTKIVDIIPKQKTFWAAHRNVIDDFKIKYSDYYYHTKSLLYNQSSSNDCSVMVEELKYLYDQFCEKKYVEPCDDKIEHIMQFLDKCVVEKEKELTLVEQLSKHAIDLNTYKESDIYDSGIIPEKIFISTVHKAKGLEFENVIVYSAIDSVYPHFYSSTKEQKLEDARKFYVAISRAKIRLVISTFSTKWVFTRRGWMPFSARETPFLNKIEKHFKTIYC